MHNKPHLNRKYERFSDFISASVSHELEDIILNAEYKKVFSLRLKKIIEELESDERALASMSVMFNTEGDIAIIDSVLVGRYISHRYKAIIEHHYRSSSLNKVCKTITESNERVALNFFSVSYDVLYDCLDEIYKEIRFKREILNKFKDKYNLAEYNSEDAGIVVNVLMIIEDMINFMGFNEDLMENIISIKLRNNYSQFI